MNWTEKLKRVPQGTLLFCLIFVILFNLAHTSPRSKKTESDLIFDEDDPKELNLILSDSKSSHKERGKSQSTKLFSWKSNSTVKNRRFQWTDSDLDNRGNFLGSPQEKPNVQALKKRKTTTRESSSSKLSPSEFKNGGDLSRKRAVQETDDEDLIYSGENGEGSAVRPNGVDIIYPHSSTTGRSDFEFERRFYRISLTIQKSWSPALESSSSSAFLLYQQELEKEIQNGMGLDVERIQVLQFININNPAFVRCVFDLGLIGTTKEQVEEEFTTYLEVGTIGSLRVERDGFYVRDVGAPQESCLDGQLQCTNGNCVSLSKRCDSINDCEDDTDEIGCEVATTTTSTTTRAPRLPERQTTTRRVTTMRPRPISTVGNASRVTVPVPSYREGCRADDQVRCSNDSQVYICSDMQCDGVDDCPNGEDEAPEKCRENNCPPQQFQCDFKCLSIKRRCDGIKDCADGQDEQNCNGLVNRCRSGEFRCNDGKCIDKRFLCDSIYHCSEKEDEIKNCPCNPRTQFQCTNGFCISNDFVCNTVKNCNDGSDETESACRNKNTTIPTRCTPTQFKCADSGLCIPKSFVCDRKRDCPGPDNSDEADCPGITPIIPGGCNIFEFQCKDDGRCIPHTSECNNYPDCNDGSDEGAKCSKGPGICSANEFRCGDGICILNTKVCNGRSDCINREDEADCSRIQCRQDQFRCSSSGGCIPLNAVCDNIVDCEFSFADEANCPVNCRNGEFTCDDGSCIPDYLKCNGRKECSGGEDENNCRPTSACKQDQFICGDGSCIQLAYVCDKYVDCPDNSDESNCTAVPLKPECNANQFACLAGSTYCIELRSRCDHSLDCQDGSDEINCNYTTTARPPPSCRPDEFSCRSRDQCVPRSAVCNGVVECNDFSDEGLCDSVVSPGGINLKTYPAEQTIRQGHEVVFQCRDEGPLRVPVRWSRGNGLSLPPGTRDYNGRLEMPSISTEHTGTYLCEAVGYSSSTPGSRVSVYLRVDHSAGKSPWSPSVLSHYDFVANTQWQSVNFPQIDPKTYSSTDIDQPPPTRPPSACGINEATCSSGECIPKHQICDGDLDCIDGSDELRCHHGKEFCEPNEFQCQNKRCVPKQWTCDGDDDCGDMSDERSCVQPPIGSPCRHHEFRCSGSGENQCIPKSMQCDKEFDCVDRSDELGCSAPVIQRPPPPLVTIGVGSWFNISCTTGGQPVPEVVWRLNWGHIPSKCISSSINGIGHLSCPDIQITDQGAYSCEAINVLGSTFAIPDCILVVQRAPSVCGSGSFNDLAESSRDCLSCFCFGHTSDCGSTKLYTSQLPPPEFNFRIVGVSQDLLGSGQVEIQDRSYVIPTSILRNVGPRGIQATHSNIRTLAIPEDIIPYFALPPSYNGNLLKGFGGFLSYNLRYRGSGRPLRAPDVIINGNGVTLLHVGKEPLSPGRDNSIGVRFWAGEWFKRVLGRPGGDQPAAGVEPASREEILMVLANVEYFLIRAQYDQTPNLDTTLSDIKLDHAMSTNTGLGPSVFVEECRCPAGYTGFSCEECAPGYERHQQGPWLGICMKSSPLVQCPPGTYLDLQTCRPCPCPTEGRRFGTTCYKDTDNQITCNCNNGHIGRNCNACAPGYQQSTTFPYDCRPAGGSCDTEGSLSPFPDPGTGRCVCKDLVSGPACNECKASTFFLSQQNQYGCISCFCMGVTSTCQSSNYYRTQETAVFVNSPLGFTLVDESQRNIIRDGFSFDRNSREIGFKDFNRYPTDIYYWQLPYNFLGNKVSSYGGYLNYTVRYVPPPGGSNSPNTAADVELNGNDIRLLYFRKIPVPANKPIEISVPLVEDHWQRQDGQLANREHLLMALANLDALLIKATYTTSTREAHISNVKLDYSVQRNTGLERAYAVEQCTCPEGYEGLSCEDCAFGFTRSLRGLYLGLCEECSCNGHSDECDPKTGVCRNCRDHTTGDFCELCETGYSGDPRTSGCRPVVAGRCNCDPRGSTSPNCPDGRNCLCKGNVEDSSCNICRRGTFALQEVNPQGCLECFCGAITSECSSATLYRSTIRINVLDGPHEVTLTDSSRTLVLEEITTDLNSGELSYVYPFGTKSERLFWSLPSKFTGNRLTSYGGKLRATRRYLVRPGTQESSIEDIDVILVGNNGISLFWIYGISAGQEVSLEVSLRETSGWKHLEGASKIANREDLLGVLSDLQAILIRASFTDDMESTYIKDISLDDAVKHYTPNGLVEEVEDCRCPVGYSGLSCEVCSPDYYRDPSNRSRGPSGACVKCPCGSNSEGCRLESGRPVCLCRPGFSGPNCESRVGSFPTSTTVPGRDNIQVSISEPTGQTVPMGGSASFRCSARSSSGPSQLRITWSRENGDIAIGRSRDDGRGLLVISQARPEDSGRYICTATDGTVTSIASVVFTVLGGQPTFGQPSFGGSRPSVSISPSYTTVRVNTPVEFQCTATPSSPPPSITWSSSRGPLPSHIVVAGNVLRIPAARKSDSGNEFICRATNNVGVESARAILYVQGGDESPAPVLPPFGLVATITPTSYEARPGEVVRFRCDTTDQSAQIQWSKQSGVIPSSAFQSPEGALTLYSVRDIDSGIYVCSAVSASGKSSQAQARLTVSFIGSPPSARIVPERQTVAQGNSIEIRCTPTGNPTPTIEWSRVGGSLPSGVQRNNELLRIDAAEVNDRGVYVCTVESSAGKSLASGIVEVERRESPLIEMYPSGKQTVIREGSALFQCRVVAGIPSPTVSWSRSDGRPLPHGTVEEIEGGVLRFNRVTGEESGQYICKAENIVGTATSVASLTIQIPPNITITPTSPLRARTGQNVRLECKSDGDPLPTVSWTRLQTGREIEDRERLHGVGTPFFAVYDIARVTKSDEGSYSCLSKSEAGQAEERFQLLVDEFDEPEYNNVIEPSVNRPASRPREEVYYFPVGSRAELRCMQAFEGGIFDQLYLDWSRGDNGRMPQDYDIRDGILYINDLSNEDAGRYSCVATNRNGEEVFTIDARLEVVGTSPPSIKLEPVRQTVRPGDIVTIHCIASGEQPITINWYKTDRRPFPRSVIVNGPQLVFRGIEVSDTGRYTCTASNTGGTSESVAEVTVSSSSGGGISYGPDAPGGPISRKEQKGFVGSTIELRCGVGGSHYSWRKDGEELPRTSIMFGPTLTLLNLNLNDAGRYLCENEQGIMDHVDLSVEVGQYHCGANEFLCLSGDQCISLLEKCDSIPQCGDYSDELECFMNQNVRLARGVESVSVRITPSKDILRVGDSLELTCDVSGDSQPQVRWSKMQNGEFQDNVAIYGRLLKIRDIRNENGGVYRCTVSTVNGIFEEDYALTIQANPDRIQNSAPIETRSVPYGSTVTMDCKTELNGPIEYTWSKQGGLINQQLLNGQSLTISDTTAEDAGTYICTAATNNPFTSEDVTTVLVVTGAVPYFTQAPTSYMTLSTLPDSYLKFDIEISFKAEDRNGLILYNGQKKDGNGDFISFGISNGYPEFRFDVGSGPAVIRGDRALETGKWHKIQLSRSRANGKMIIDDQETFTGTIHGSFQGLDLMEPLYIGGHPNFNSVHRLAGHSKGFVGCISELVIGGKRQQLFKDSQISRGVSSCETCISSSCTNGGVCQEGLSNRGYSCICPPGYSGENCEVSGQSCYPGSCGSGKCVNVFGGFECFCPFGKTGVRCERDVVIYEPSFNSDSYLAYPTPQDLKKLKVGLKVKPETEEDGLLMYCSQTNDGLGDYTSLAIRDKRLEFQYDTGSGPAVIRSKKEVVAGEWLSITIERNLQDGELIINGSEVNKGKSPGITRGLNLKTPLYLGGHDRHRVKLNSNVGVRKGFSGCVSELDVRGMNLDLVNSVLEGANVDNCESDSEFCSSCQNGARCGNSTCICLPGFSGRYCEIRDSCSLKPCQNGGTCYSLKNSYRCSCPKGFFSKNCETAMESWSHSVAFRGEGYIELSKSFMQRNHAEEPEKVEFEVSTTAASGLLLWHGPLPSEVDPDDFFSVGVNSEGKIELQWDYGSGITKVVSKKSINDGEKHNIVLKRQGQHGSIEVDGGNISDFGSNDSPPRTLNARGNIYVGGVPNPYQMTQGLYSSGFIGCIHSLKIQSDEAIDLNENAMSAVNTGPCSKSKNGNNNPQHNKHKLKKPNGNSKHTTGDTEYSKSKNQVIEDNYDDDAEEFFLEGRHRLS